MSATPSLPTNDVIDRRIELRREMDRRLVAALFAVSTILVSLGVAWGTATASLAQKVDRTDQLTVDAAQDRRIDSLSVQAGSVADALKRLQTGVDSANTRLRQLACDGKPASCR
jgi:hypothetical protein